ncbi:Abi family protein [Prevotella bivia]|nr:Abi family protein [Prevotella bivia]
MLGLHDAKITNTYEIMCIRREGCNWVLRLTQNNGEGANHEFLRKDISFQDVIDLYCFDRRLRSLIFNAIEKIEVALRTRIALTYSVDENDAFWFLNHKLYFQHDKFIALTRNEIIDDKPVVGDLMKEVKRSNEEFIAHYYQKYSEPAFPPAWMTLEVVSMGTLSKLFFALDKNNPSSKTICRDLGLYNVDILKNWMHGLSSLRNTCAHHSRVWNRRFTIALKFPYRTNYPFLSKQEAATIRDNKLFAYLSVILYLQQIISPDSSFRKSLLTLLDKSPKLVVLKDMGFPEKWREYSLWK